jgi:hypothetical protein
MSGSWAASVDQHLDLRRRKSYACCLEVPDGPARPGVDAATRKAAMGRREEARPVTYRSVGNAPILRYTV